MENEKFENNSFSSKKTETNNKNGNRILIVLLLLSFALNIFQWFDKGSKVDSYEERIDSMAVTQQDVEKELAMTHEELEKYRGMSAQLDSLLNIANSDLDAKEKNLQEMIKKEKNSSTLNKKLNAELAELRKLRNEYLEKIDELILENKRLMSQNDSLNVELTNSISTVNNLDAKVKVAEQLRTDQVVVQAYKKRAVGGKLVETSLAKKTVKLEVCFRVLENAIAAKGNRQISLRIIAPNGETLAGASNGSFTSTKNNQELTATATYMMDYNGSTSNACMNWEDEKGTLEPGDYEIEIYIDGVAVFAGAYTLE